MLILILMLWGSFLAPSLPPGKMTAVFLSVGLNRTSHGF